MRTQAFINQDASAERYSRDAPKIDRELWIPPKRRLINKTVAIPLHDIKHGIQLQNNLIMLWQNMIIPKNRRQPKTKLNQDIDNLSDIFQKDVN